MNLVSLASHTVDLDLLPHSPLVLDVGCRGFDFTRAIYRQRPEAEIVAMDPAPDVLGPDELELPDLNFLHFALVGDDKFVCNLAHHSTGEGDFVCDESPWYAESHRVSCANIKIVMSVYRVKHWDLVKLDCEGSEFGILENWPGPIATQLSVEFHDWTGPWSEHVVGDYYELLFAGPLTDYEVVQHELSRQGEGIGHWDSVFRLRT